MGLEFELLASGKNSDSGCLVGDNLLVGNDEGIAGAALAVATAFEMGSVQIPALAGKGVPDVKGRQDFYMGVRHNIG